MQRLLRLTATALKSSLNVLLAPAEDPRQTYADPGQHQRDLLAQVQQALEANAALQARLEGRLAQLRERLSRLDAQARQALGAGREDLARLALQRKQTCLAELARLDQQLAEAADEESRLTRAEQQFAQRLDAFRGRRLALSARYTAAQAQTQAIEALMSLSGESAVLGSALERAEEKIERLQARAAALNGLVAENDTLAPGEDAVEQALRELSTQQAVEAELAALKAEGQPAPASP